MSSVQALARIAAAFRGRVPVAGLNGVRAIAAGGDVPPPREQPTGGTSWALH